MHNTLTPIYPTGCGHYALRAPDGVELQQGQKVELLLNGHKLPGQVGWSHHGDYIQFADNSIVGLYPAMRVIPDTVGDEEDRQQRPRWSAAQLNVLSSRYRQLSAEPGRTIYSIGLQIARENDWPAARVWARLYRLQADLDAQKQLQLKRRQLFADLPPIALTSGSHPWVVEILRPLITLVWWLEFAKSACPLSPGQLCFYEDQLYRVGRVGNSSFSVVLLPSIQA